MKIPTEQEVRELVRKTGESTRKCYFWLLHEMNKGEPKDQPSLFDVTTDTSDGKVPPKSE